MKKVYNLINNMTDISKFNLSNGIVLRWNCCGEIHCICGDFRLTLRFEDGRIIAPIQSEIEGISLERVGSTSEIFFKPIFLSENIFLMFKVELKAWELCTN